MENHSNGFAGIPALVVAVDACGVSVCIRRAFAASGDFLGRNPNFAGGEFFLFFCGV